MSDSTPTRPSAPPPTTARLSLGNNSPAQTTADHLRFQLDHSLARDAVHTPLDLTLIQTGLKALGVQPIILHSGVDALFAPNAPAAELRRTYLLRPDLGRTLHPDSIATLEELQRDLSSRPKCSAVERPASETSTEPLTQPTTLFILADGLSALALERHALPLLDAVLPSLSSILYPQSPVVTNARVAIADPIGQILRAQITVLLIGERPGLSSPDSLGCYITWDPRPGRTDAERNCISNIRGDDGLSYTEAAQRIAHYIHEAQRLHTTGTSLKDPTTTHALPADL